MPDRIEKLVDKALPLFEVAVTARASRDESLEQLLLVGRDKSALPYEQKGALGGDEATLPELLKLKGTFNWAYELAYCKTYSADELKQPEKSLQTQAADFAEKALELEREAVFCELRERSQKVEVLDPGTLRAAVRDLKGVCRFIGSSQHAREAEKMGVLVDLKGYPGADPPGTVGMLIRLDQGPIVRRLAEGLSLSWTRISSEEVELELSERFFLDRPDQVRWFESVAPPTPAAPAGATAVAAPPP